MKKTLFMAMLIGCCSSALAVSMNVTPDGDGQKVTFTWADGENKGKINQSIEASVPTTIEVDAGKDVTVFGPENDAGCVTGTGGVTKTGKGDLSIRLNDTRRNMDTTSTNDFRGNVTVEEGTMTLVRITQGAPTKATIGGGSDLNDYSATITVKDGASLYMTGNTGIDIPNGGIDTRGTPYAPNRYVQIDGGNTETECPDLWACNFGDGSSMSRIDNAVITVSGIRNENADKRAAVRSSGMILYNQTAEGKAGTEHADIIVDDFYANGNIEIKDSRIRAQFITCTAINGELQSFHTKVTDHSTILCDYTGYMTNVDVDATSKVQFTGDPEEGMFALVGTNKLEVMSLKDGVAERVQSQQAYLVDNVALQLTTLTFNTDQVKGDILMPGNGVPAQLQVELVDSDLPALLKDLEKKGVVFTLVLEGLDSSYCIADAETGELNKDLVALTIAGYDNPDLFKDGTISGVFNGTDTVFHFSTTPNVDFYTEVDVPEPTTGALSLLALAGLCARRRRK